MGTVMSLMIHSATSPCLQPRLTISSTMMTPSHPTDHQGTCLLTSMVLQS